MDDYSTLKTAKTFPLLDIFANQELQAIGELGKKLKRLLYNSHWTGILQNKKINKVMVQYWPILESYFLN